MPINPEAGLEGTEVPMAAATSSDKERLLAKNFLLQHLPPEVLRQIGAYARIVRYDANSVIFHKDDAGESMMAVVRGRIKVSCFSADGRELVFSILKAGDILGEIALLDGEPRTADAVALEDCDLLVLERRYLLPFLEAHPDVCLDLLRLLCRRLRCTSEQFEDCLFLEPQMQLARCLMRLAEVFGKPARDGVLIDLKLSQRQIGGLIGRSRESVNRQLQQFQSSGLITMTDGYITINDKDSLKLLAHQQQE
jgi:CRP/FNR family cyclic AMP-dependent transcriptional regulator